MIEREDVSLAVELHDGVSRDRRMRVTAASAAAAGCAGASGRGAL
jgi:hypothetical protein